ncbi:MAG: efflux RND transporter periplasmic adaptor subunit [Proteobacteria bacterium]|nr:efflux RND transporter periplasmic adaptor subunit [Pseudomonadota bacterium]
MKPTAAMLALAACATLLQTGCHGPPAAARGVTAAPVPAPAAPDPAVQLSAAQVQSLRVEPVTVQEFSTELPVVGTVSLEEDPAIIQAESTLLSAQANLAVSHREWRRVQELGEANGIASRDIESARATELAAAAAARAALEALRALGVPDRQIESLERTGRFEPRSHPGSWVVLNVPESDSAHLARGQTVRVAVTALPGRWFTGVVSRVYAAVDPATHRLAARARIDDPQRQLRPGMLADVTIRYGRSVAGVAIPTTAAVRESDGTMIAWVTADRRHFVSRRLTLGREDGGRYQVLAGLAPGDLVVAEGGVFLSNLLQAAPDD